VTPAKTVNLLVPDLKRQGAHAVVVVLHQGAFQDATGTYDSCAGLSGDLLPILKGDPDAGERDAIKRLRALQLGQSRLNAVHLALQNADPDSDPDPDSDLDLDLDCDSGRARPLSGNRTNPSGAP
jgi:hypothetical protein